MAQKFIQSENFSFKVEAAPSFMQLPNGSFVKDGFTVNRRTDTLEVLGKVTDRYGIVQNDDLINAAEDAFAKHGLSTFTRKVCVTGSGEKMYAQYDFASCVKKLANVGDEVGLRLTVQNSFDGSLRASFASGILRLICKNGAATVQKEQGMTQKHGSKVSVDFIGEALQKAVDGWEKSLFVFDRLAAVELTQIQGSNILSRLSENNLISGKVLEGIAAIWAAPTHTEDSARNLYNLYNAVTQYLTHEVAAERFELANRVSQNVLGLFERVSRDAGKLAKLTAPVLTATVVEVA